jgi:hypothetical protein
MIDYGELRSFLIRKENSRNKELKKMSRLNIKKAERLLLSAMQELSLAKDIRYSQADIELFSKLTSEIDISKYNQKEFREIVDVIYWNIFVEEET